MSELVSGHTALKLHLESCSASFSVTTLHQIHTGAECNTHVVLRASEGHQRPAHPQTLSPGEATAHHFSADQGGFLPVSKQSPSGAVSPALTLDQELLEARFSPFNS